MNKDIGNYFYDVEFETLVYNDVYWVPVHSLGKTKYTSDEMIEICKLPLEEKRNKIDNLYEAIQLFQISEFKGTLDNKDYWINGIHWQTHKTPKEAVFFNEGCCATDTNWLAYFIGDKYDKVGSFCYGNIDGNGHITTYIKQNEFYYFIDMMMCRKDSQKYFCKETGLLEDIRNTEWAGFLFKSKNPVDFCQFYVQCLKSKHRDIPYCFYMRDTNCVTATASSINDKEITFYVPTCDNPQLIYKDNITTHRFFEVELPTQLRMKQLYF